MTETTTAPPLSAAQIHRHTPARYGADDPAAPVFLVKTPGHFEKLQFQRELTAAAGAYPSEATLIKLVREALAMVDGADEAAMGGIVAAVEREFALRAALPATERGLPPELAESWAMLVDACAVHPGVRSVLARREHRFGSSLVLAAQMFVTGWENVRAAASGEALAFERRRGMIPAELLDRVDLADVMDVGTRAVLLMAPDEGARKNSAPPLLSRSTPSASPTESSTAAAATDGTLPANSGS